MKKKTRKKYTPEFKEEAIKLITEQGYGLTIIPSPSMASIEPVHCYQIAT